MLIVVHAEEDRGSMSDLTRLKPRRVLCRLSPFDEGAAPSSLHVIKYRQPQMGRSGVCALISEVIGAVLFRAAGIPCVEPRLAIASGEFADHCNRLGTIPYTVLAGTHFATPYIRGEAGPVIKLVRLSAPQQVVDLWVLDCWLRTTDRHNDGNTLLVPVAGDKCDLYAIDQSDCFGGPQRLTDGTWVTAMRSPRRAEDAGCLSQAVFSCGGPSSIEQALSKVDVARQSLDGAVGEVPGEWWREAQVDPAQIKQELDRRYRGLRALVDPGSWPNPEQLGDGGYLLGGDEHA